MTEFGVPASLTGTAHPLPKAKYKCQGLTTPSQTFSFVSGADEMFVFYEESDFYDF